MIDKIKGTFSKFPKVFWVAQTFEMMERGAYYSMMPIIVYHAIYNVGLGEELGAIIAAFMYPFQYGLPIFSGALAEKVGYKKQMTFAFIFLTIAYFYLFTAYNTFTMITAMMAVGVGIGSYKPLISATVAKCTSSEDRNLAYSVYYLVVNLAAFLFPLVFYFLEFGGYLAKSDYYIVFGAAAVMVGINIFTSIFIFEEVPRSGKVKTVADAVNNIKIAFQDKKFVVMVVLIGGFWALYSTMLTALPVIIFGFRWYPWFLTPMLLGVFNPLTIIVLGMPLGKFSERVESMRVLLGGLLVYLIGLTIICFSLQNWEMLIIGIIIASIGEFLIAPGYLSFISKLAPKENVSAYIGCNFISYMIGLLGGTIVFGLIVAYVAVALEMPYFFYGILIAFGLFLLIAFTFYYQTWGQDVISRARKIRELEEGLDKSTEIESTYKEPILFRLFDNKITPTISLILIPLILFITYSMGTFNYIGPDRPELEIPKFDIEDYDVLPGTPIPFNSDLQEGASESQTITIQIMEKDLVSSIKFELIWHDEANEVIRGREFTNQPDTFKMAVSQGNNYSDEVSGSNPQGSEGNIQRTFDFSHDTIKSLNGTGIWTVEITLQNCGNQEPPFNLFDLRTIDDTSNAYELKVTPEFYTPKSG